MADSENDGLIVVTGEDRVRVVGELVRLHKWRSMATMKALFNMTPTPGCTIKLFNETYGTSCKRWIDVHAAVTAILNGDK